MGGTRTVRNGFRKTRRGCQTLLADRKGGPVVELALILPVLLILLLGMFEFAFLLYQKQLITKGVQDAARFAARNTSLIENGTCPPSSGGWAQTVVEAQQIATRGTTGGSTMLSNFDTGAVNVSVSCPSAGTLATSNPVSGSIPIVTVTASVNALSLGFFSVLGVDSVTLAAEHSEFGVGL